MDYNSDLMNDTSAAPAPAATPPAADPRAAAINVHPVNSRIDYSSDLLSDTGTNPSKQPEPTVSVAGDVAAESGKGLTRGLENAAGDIGEAVMGPFGPAHHFGNLMADFGLAERPKTDPTYGQQLHKATGMEASPQTTPGKYAGSIAEVAGNPASYIGPGGAIPKLIGAAGQGAGSEAAGELAHEYLPSLETPARIAGGFLVELPVEYRQLPLKIPCAREIFQARLNWRLTPTVCTMQRALLE